MGRTTDWFVKEIENKNLGLEIINYDNIKYKNNKTKYVCRCKKCGKSWESTVYRLMTATGCKFCNIEKLHMQQRKTDERFIEQMKTINPNVVILGKYETAKKKLKCLCNICGHKWFSQPSNLLCGFGCPNCKLIKMQNQPRKSNEEFVREMSEKNPLVIPIGKYISYGTNVECECAICGAHFVATPSNLLREKSGCLKCKISHGEKEIMIFLDKNHIKYEWQKSYDDLRGIKGGKLSYDFYLPKYNLLIEYNGEFHDGNNSLQTRSGLITQKHNDKIKEEYAISHDYSFKVIWYYEFKNIDKILKSLLQIP